MNPSVFWHILRLIVILVFPLHIFGCASIGPTKPNLPYADNSHPVVLNELAKTNPLLVQELGKLPEIQDGISEHEMSALKNIVELYRNDPIQFDNTFNEMYEVGLPEYRKYCSPLQALFWLAEDEEMESLRSQIQNYSLRNLLDSSWIFDDRVTLEELEITDQEAKTIVASINKEVIWYAKHQETAKDVVILCYNRNPKAIPRKYRELIKRDKIYQKSKLKLDKNKLRWETPKMVIDRLNAPELLDYYIDRNIVYAHYIPSYHIPYSTIIKQKYGDCDDLANFGRHVLTKAGYMVSGRVVGNIKVYCHIGLYIELEDGSYLLAVDLRRNGTNNMSGPYKTILEVDQALGYGHRFGPERNEFYFLW